MHRTQVVQQIDCAVQVVFWSDNLDFGHFLLHIDHSGVTTLRILSIASGKCCSPCNLADSASSSPRCLSFPTSSGPLAKLFCYSPRAVFFPSSPAFFLF